MEAYGLGQRLNIPTEEAAEILDAYFVAFPNVKAVHGPHGRPRPASGATPRRCSAGAGRSPSCRRPNFRIRQAGERQAMNAGIQGLAADIFKVALVRLDDALEEGGLRQPPHPAGARRGAPRGAAGRARRRGRAHASRRCRARSSCSVPARGQPGLRPHLGRRQGLRSRRDRWRAPPASPSDHQSDGLAGGTSSKNAVIIGSRTCTLPRSRCERSPGG